jgi:RNA polymerase sigma-70 factor, ECF subfamily
MRSVICTLSYSDLPPPANASVDDEQVLLLALRDRDEAAFEWLLDRYYAPMLRLARTFVRSREDAQEVVQDAWLAVLAGIEMFEGRSSLKTWIFRIVANRARSRAKREAKQVPFSSLARPSTSSDSSSSTTDWLFDSGTAEPLWWSGQANQPTAPDESVLARELHELIDSAISKLPKRQQIVISLRDMDGWSAEEVCALLEISVPNQRVLLHRARLKVRDAIEGYVAPLDAVAGREP